MGQEKRQWAVGDLMTKGSKAVCGGVDTEEVSLHIRERCDCALASDSASRGPPAGPLLAAWPGHPDAVSLLCKPLHMCVCPSAGHREDTTQSVSVLPDLLEGPCLVDQRQS